MLNFCWDSHATPSQIKVLGWSGVDHGFIGQSSTVLPGVRLLHQVHGKDIVDLRTQAALDTFTNSEPGSISADGLIARVSSKPSVAIGIQTADCAPVMLRLGETFALVHAGWRGLAQGILTRALELLAQENIGGNIECIVGPCAHSCCYEVGDEVIAALGPIAKSRTSPTNPTKAFLSVGETALESLQQGIKKLGAQWSLNSSYANLCTICDTRFHSYRREGKGCGRNIAYLIV